MNTPLPDDSRTAILRNAGGVYNHELYFNCLGPAVPASNYMKDVLNQYFTSEDIWQKAMKDAALSVFGSGYALIGADSSKKLQLMTAANQDTPLHLHITPLLLIDVWEHAYYLRYQNRRADYIDQIFPLLNWDFIEQRYQSL